MKRICETIVAAANGGFRASLGARRRLVICSVFLLAFLSAETRASVPITSVSLTAPFDGENFRAPASILLTAEASAATGTITTVGFYNGTNLLGSATNAPYTYMWANVVTGLYSLTAQAVVNSGAVSTSAVAAIQVLPIVINTNNFTTPGITNWLCPVGVTSVVVECWGAGGAGGSAQGTSGGTQCGGGGAGGAYTKYNLYAVIPGSNYYINVGAGQINNFLDNGHRASGGDSWFNTNSSPSSIIIATGGAGGASAVGSSTGYGLGGTGTTDGSAGNVVRAGGSGAAGASDRAGGGGSSAGTNSAGTAATSNVGAVAPDGGGDGGTGPTTISTNGVAGLIPGGGGSGAESRDDGILRAGGAGASGKVALTFSANVVPIVKLTAPTNGSSFTAPASIILTANASDADGVVTTVGFYNVTNLIGSDTSSPYSYTWTNVTAGIYNLTAWATDNSGAISKSALAVITVMDTRYPLTVNNGTGSGTYTNGQRVAIAASNAPVGLAFNQWIGDTQYVNNVNSTNALVTMSTNPVALTATYTDAKYTLTVNSGAGGGSYTNGTQVAIASAAPGFGLAFNKWTGSTQYLASVTASNTTVTMPALNIAVTATYTNAYTLTVIDGTGSGSYTNGAQVAIWAETPAAGKAFVQWAGDTQYVANASSANTTVTVPAQAIVLIATYADALYPLTVNNGTGSGSYTNGQVVEITADAPASGKTFSQWNGNAQGVASGTSATSTVIMPAQAVTLTATYKNIPGYYILTVNNGSGGGAYTNGTQVAISATNTPESGAVFDRWTGDTQCVDRVVSLNTIVTMPEQDVALTASCVDVSNGVASVPWGCSGFIYQLNPDFASLLGPTGSGKSTIAQLMYSPDDIKDSILPNGAGAENDVVWDTITLTENGDELTEWGIFSANTVRAGMNGYVYALIFQDNDVQPGDFYVAGPLVPLVDGAPNVAFVDVCVDPGNGDDINGVNSAQVIEGNAGYTLTINSGTGGGTYTNEQQVAISANPPAFGKVFDQWTGDTQVVNNVSYTNALVTMSTNPVALTATYKYLPGQHTLTVNSGSGSGSYTNGTEVVISAAAVSGKAFSQWTGDTQYVNNGTFSSALVAILTNVTLTATYVDVNYGLTVTSGSGDGAYTNGQQVAITADAIPGKIFNGWIGATQYVASASSASTTVTMPAQSIAVTATYVDALYPLTVNNGTGGGGSYTNGTKVLIAANSAPTGQAFDQWIGDVQVLASVTASNTTVTMPAQAVTLTATYKNLYALTVNGGSGSGLYTNTQTVVIAADPPASGKVFDQWTGDTVYVGNSNGANTTVTMPAKSIAVTAKYKDAQYTLTVTNGTGSGSYTNMKVVAIVASNAPAGQTFVRWIGDTQFVANVIATNTTVTMPTQAVFLAATYNNFYPLKVTNGTGSGLYTNTQVVAIAASNAPSGMTFYRWTGDTQFVASVIASNTTVAMPTQAVSLTATYTNLPNWYTLTVNGGSGSGSYTNTRVVAIAANAPAVGKTFSQWIGDTQYVDNVTYTNASVTISNNPVNLTATYADVYYGLTVIDGSGSGSYPLGSNVTIAAGAPPSGMAFDRWIGATQYLASVTASNTTVTMPAQAISLAATYKNVYALTVTNGTGSGLYTNTQVVAIAAAAPSGEVFVRWIGDTQFVASVTSSPTVVTMPAQAVSLTATFKNVYALTVTNGTGSGLYTNTQVVAIAASNAPSGEVFGRWIGDTQFVASVLASNTTVTMPTQAVFLAATYTNAYVLTVTGGTGGGSYAKGAQATITATLPAGMAFDHWTGATQYVASVTSSPTVVTMPAADTAVAATYKAVYYTFTVINGTGSGFYTNGHRVAIAATVPKGTTFLRWNDGNTNASRTVTMPPAPVTYTATVIDMQKPTVKITSPKKSQKIMTNGTVVIRGTAADNYGLAGVKYQLYSGVWTNASTTDVWENWTAEYSPVSGLNTTRVYSVDVQGNTSATSTVVFTYVPGAVMEVQITGDGTVKPDYNGKVLQIGKSYKMEAKPAKYSSFANWTYGVGGTVASINPHITFIMESNLVLTANFSSLVLLGPPVLADMAIAAPATPQAEIVVDGSAKDWANVPRSSFSYASVTQEVAVALDGNSIALLLNGCPFETSDNVLVYFKLRLSYGVGDARHSVDLWTSGSVLRGMVDGQVISGLEAVLLNGVLEVKLPVEQAPSQVTIEELGCGMDLGGGTLTELFKLTPPPASIQ